MAAWKRKVSSTSSSHETETLAERKKRKALATRGEFAETKVHNLLRSLATASPEFDFDRLLDSRAAGKIVAAQVSDFLIFYRGHSATLEVKEMKKGLRLTAKDFPQHPRMLRREKAGCKGFVLVYALQTESWWLGRVTEMENGVPSWVLTEVAEEFSSVEAAMVKIQFTLLGMLGD